MLSDLKVMMKENYDITNIKLESNFKNDFGLTSFDFINLICLIEEKFSIEIEEAMYRKLNTVDDLVRYLESKRCN